MRNPVLAISAAKNAMKENRFAHSGTCAPGIGHCLEPGKGITWFGALGNFASSAHILPGNGDLFGKTQRGGAPKKQQIPSFIVIPDFIYSRKSNSLYTPGISGISGGGSS